MLLPPQFSRQLKSYECAHAVTVYGKRPIEQTLDMRVKLRDQILDPRMRRNVFSVLASWQLCLD